MKMVEIVEVELSQEESKNYNFKIYADFEDGYLCYIYGEDKEICMYELKMLINIHRVRCTYYTFVKDENRTDGEWIGKEQYVNSKFG